MDYHSCSVIIPLSFLYQSAAGLVLMGSADVKLGDE